MTKINAVTYLYSHGFGDTGRQARKYMREYKTKSGRIKKNNFYIIDGECKTFNYPDALCKPISNIFRTSLGQENELQALRDAYYQVAEKENDIVLIGVSRGASAAANFIGSCDCKKVKAVILISPFAHVYDVFKTNFFYRLFSKISQFDKTGMHPIDLISKMNKNTPILFMCSKTDKTVQSYSTLRLYRKLVLSGHKHAYMLCLEAGRHARFMKSDEAERVQNVTHAFYKKYGLPCNDEFAVKGVDLLEACSCHSTSIKSFSLENFGIDFEDFSDVKSIIKIFSAFPGYLKKFLSK